MYAIFYIVFDGVPHLYAIRFKNGLQIVEYGIASASFTSRTSRQADVLLGPAGPCGDSAEERQRGPAAAQPAAADDDIVEPLICLS